MANRVKTTKKNVKFLSQEYKMFFSHGFRFNNKTIPNDKVSNFVFTQNSSSILILTEAGFLIVYDLLSKNIRNIFDVGLKFNIPLDYRTFTEYNQLDILSDSTVLCSVLTKSGIVNFQNGNLQKMILNDIPHNFVNLSNKKRYFTAMLFGGTVVVYDLHLDSIVSVMYEQPSLIPRIGVGVIDSQNQIVYEKDFLLSKYDFINNKNISYFGIDGSKFRFSPDNKYLYCYSGYSWKIDMQSGKILELSDKNVLEYNHKSTHFAHITYQENGVNNLHIQNMQTNQDEYVSQYEGNNIFVIYSNDDNYFVIKTLKDKMIKVIETKNYSVVDSFNYDKLSDSWISEVHFSYDNKYITFLGDDNPNSSDGLKLIIRDIQNKEFLCEEPFSVDMHEKYKFLKNGMIIGTTSSYSYLSIFEPCPYTIKGNIVPKTGTDYIQDFYISEDSKYCLGLSIGYGGQNSYNHLFIYDIDKKEHIQKLDGDSRNWALSNDNKYLALADEIPSYVYLYDFQKIVTSVNDDNEISKIGSLMISPNPATDFIDINLNNEVSLIAFGKVQIFDILGIEVMFESIHPMTQSHRINVSGLPTGVYYIKIGDKVEKFLKME